MNEAEPIGAHEEELIEAPISLSAPREFLNEYPGHIWKREMDARAAIEAKAVFTFKVRTGENVEEAGHFKVDPVHAYKERNTATLLRTWAGLVRQDLLPPRTKWLELYNAKLTPHEKIVAAAMADDMWTMLTSGGQSFEDEGGYIVYESGGGFGMLTRVNMDTFQDAFYGDTSLRPIFKHYGFDSFVLDSNAEDWRESFAVVKTRYSLKALRDLAKPQHDAEGRLIRGPVFDPDAVQEAINLGPSKADSGALSSAKDGRKGADPGGRGGEYFEALEFMGAPDSAEHELPDDVVITTINGICVRASENPYPFRTWVFMNWKKGEDGNPYGESIGYELAQKETVINRAMTYAEQARYNKLTGVLTYDANRQDEAVEIIEAGLAKFSRQNILPDYFKEMPYRPDLSDADQIRQQTILAMQEIIGVSQASLAGLPSPGVTATASQGADQGSKTRNNDDAIHYAGPFAELLEIVYKLWIEELEDGAQIEVTDPAQAAAMRAEFGQMPDNVVQFPGGEPVPQMEQEQEPERVFIQVDKQTLRSLKLRVRLNSVAQSATSPYKIQQLQQARGFPSANQGEVDKLIADALGIPEQTQEKIFAPPPAPPMPVEQQQPQPAPMPGPEQMGATA